MVAPDRQGNCAIVSELKRITCAQITQPVVS
jgi:hypothetical protein